MIQFNLLPDVKKEYIKAKRTKRLIMSIATLSAASALGITLLLFVIVQINQKGHIERLTKDIETEIAAIESIEDLDKVLTIQNQLGSLPGLHEAKPEASRIFAYLNQLVPTEPDEVKVSEVSIDFVQNTMLVSGTGNSLASVNKFVDTVKFATYTVNGEGSSSPFSDVLTEMSRDEERATYKMTLTFDPQIFNNTVEIALVVPSQITTRSVVDKPTFSEQQNSLFENAPTEEGEE